VGTEPDWRGNRLSAAPALHLPQFAHQLRPLGHGLVHHQAFPNKAGP
jgi:hypothetical protein